MTVTDIAAITEGVVVTARFRSSKSMTSQCCGLRFNDFIIAPGLLLEPFMFLRLVEHLKHLKQTPADDMFISKKTIEDYRLKLPSFCATLDNRGSTYDSNQPLECHCDVLLVWNFSTLRDTIRSNLNRWKFLPRTGRNSHIRDRLELLSMFLVLRIQNSTGKTSTQRVDDALIGLMSELAGVCEPRIRRGSDIVSISTPFFLKHFLNSWHKGIISNLFGSDDCLLLVDVDLPPESEGALLLAQNCSGVRKNIVGMTITSSCQFEEEQVGFCLAVNFKSLVQDFLRKHKRNYIWKCVADEDLSFAPYENQIKDIIDEHLDACVALITTQQSWGTGVVISLSPPLILTCSHVVSQKQEISVTIGSCKSPAKVVYSTPLGQIYDLAVISFIPNSFVRKIRIASMPPKLGEPVYAVGFPLLKSTQPSVSCGIVSQMTKPGGPMLTSCCLHSGGSGAPLVRPDGSLLGIMTSFVCLSEATSRNFPRLSITVSSTVFGHCLEKFLGTEDQKSLLQLTSNDPEITKLWTLSSPSLLKCHL